MIGSVKFFDTKKGWGFITMLTQGHEKSNTEVFVHFSNLNVSDNGYKRLYPGEYVSFSLGKNDRGKDTCIDVSGIQGGPLLADHPEHRYKIFPKVSSYNKSVTGSDETMGKETGKETDEVTDDT